LRDSEPFLAHFFVFESLIALVLHFRNSAFELEFLLLELFFVLNSALLKVLNTLLQLPLINIHLLSARYCQISRRFRHNLGAHLRKALCTPTELRPISLESLLNLIDFLLDHIHTLIEIFMKLLSHCLHLWLEEFPRFALAIARELCFMLLAAARDSLSEHPLVLGDVLAERSLLEKGHTLLTYLLMALLEDALVHFDLRLGQGPFHLSSVALNRFVDRSVALVLTDVRPSILDVWH